MRRPRYVNGSSPTATLMHHVTCSPFWSPSRGISLSWDKMCKSQTGNCSERCENAGETCSFAQRARTCSRGRRTCRPDSDPSSISAVCFVLGPVSRHHPHAPAGVSRPGMTLRWCERTTPGGIPSDGMPFVRKHDCESNPTFLQVERTCWSTL